MVVGTWLGWRGAWRAGWTDKLFKHLIEERSNKANKRSCVLLDLGFDENRCN